MPWRSCRPTLPLNRGCLCSSWPASRENAAGHAGASRTKELVAVWLTLDTDLFWWTHQDLNLGPLACEASALTGLSYASTRGWNYCAPDTSPARALATDRDGIADRRGTVLSGAVLASGKIRNVGGTSPVDAGRYPTGDGDGKGSMRVLERFDEVLAK